MKLSEGLVATEQMFKEKNLDYQQKIIFFNELQPMTLMALALNSQKYLDYIYLHNIFNIYQQHDF